MGIRKIRKSPLRREKFRKSCEVYKLEILELVLDVSTRWNSTYFMLERVFKLRKAYSDIVNTEKPLRKFFVDGDEWKLIECLIEFLSVNFKFLLSIM